MPSKFMIDDLPIKVGFLVSYDYELLRNALPLVYSQSSKIVLALDSQLKTWTGNRFSIEPTFFEWLEDLDCDNKIFIYRDSFYIENLSPIECETIERRKLAEFMGEGGWHVQLDADEYFLDFHSFAKYLRAIENRHNLSIPIEIFAKLLPILKSDDDGFYMIETQEAFSFATNVPSYKNARHCNHELRIQSDFCVAHQSWARSPEEIRQKVNNWGHANDFDIEGFYKLWLMLDSYNYRLIKNLHPLTPTSWPSIYYIKSEGIQNLLTFLFQKELLEKPSPAQDTWLEKFKRPENSFGKFLSEVTPPFIFRKFERMFSSRI